MTSHKRKEHPDGDGAQPPEKKQKREARGLSSLRHPDDIKNSDDGGGERKVLPRILSAAALAFACLTFVSTVLVRQCERRKEGEAQKTPKKKQWRTKRPPEEECIALTEVEQNSPAWYAARALSSGASSLYSFCGWSKFKLNTDQYKEDAGIVSEPERSVEDCFFCDHGHHYEDEARLVAEFFLGCVAFTTGLWIHPMFPYAHASPDGLLVYAATALTWISACFAADALTGLMEIKCPIYGAYIARTKRYPWPHTIPVEYIIQQMAQMSCLNAPWSDFVVYWHANERKGLQPFEWVDKSVPCTQWKIAELMVSRLWFNKELTRLIYTELRKHIKRVNEGTPPELVTKMKFNNEKVKWVPVLHAVFYLTGVPSDAVIGTYDTGIIDTSVIVKHMGSKESRPDGWRGEWPPTMQCRPVYYFDTEPVWNTLHEIEAL